MKPKILTIFPVGIGVCQPAWPPTMASICPHCLLSILVPGTVLSSGILDHVKPLPQPFGNHASSYMVKTVKFESEKSRFPCQYDDGHSSGHDVHDTAKKKYAERSRNVSMRGHDCTRPPRTAIPPSPGRLCASVCFRVHVWEATAGGCLARRERSSRCTCGSRAQRGRQRDRETLVSTPYEHMHAVSATGRGVMMMGYCLLSQKQTELVSIYLQGRNY